MRLEFRIPISPTPQFYSTLRLAALSLRSLGSPYDSAQMLVSVGDYADLDMVRAAEDEERRHLVQALGAIGGRT